MALNDSAKKSNSKKQQTETVNTSSSSSKSSSKPPLPLRLAAWFITGIIISIVLINIKPYEILAGRLFQGIEYQALSNILVNIPFVGGLFGMFFGLINLTAGTMFWVVVQALELIPTSLMGNQVFLDKNIQRADRNQYRKDSNDSWEVKIAKTMRNSISTETLRFLIIVGCCTYIFDFFACLMIFPPVVGGGDMWKLFDILSTEQFELIDWGNILKAVSTVGAVQFLVGLRKHIIKVIHDLKD
ncbi:MAG: hypothetical protein AAF383_02265 [Cyanobacteria bacterium P01_A01_bin.83]